MHTYKTVCERSSHGPMLVSQTLYAQWAIIRKKCNSGKPHGAALFASTAKINDLKKKIRTEQPRRSIWECEEKIS